MLNIILNQTKQYEAYTDRYLDFKVNMRKVVPYKQQNNYTMKNKINHLTKNIDITRETLLQSLKESTQQCSTQQLQLLELENDKLLLQEEIQILKQMKIIIEFEFAVLNEILLNKIENLKLLNVSINKFYNAEFTDYETSFYENKDFHIFHGRTIENVVTKINEYFKYKHI